jgi:hypothetical protein
VRDLVIPLPPDSGQAEGELGKPDDPEAEHAEQHSGADPARRRLAHQPVPAAGVEHEDRQQRDGRQQAVDEEEALVGGTAVEERVAEEAVR